MFLNAHTVTDTQQLMDLIDFRVKKVDELFRHVMDPVSRGGMSMTGKDADTIKKNWADILKRWDDTKSSVGRKLLFARATNPLPVNMTAVSNDVYDQVRGFVEMDSGDPNIHPMDSIRGIQDFLEKVSDIKLDLDTDSPVPVGVSSTDPDHAFMTSPTINAAAAAGGAIAKKADDIIHKPDDHTIRNLAIGAGVVLVLILGIQVLPLIVVPLRALSTKR